VQADRVGEHDRKAEHNKYAHERAMRCVWNFPDSECWHEQQHAEGGDEQHEGFVCAGVCELHAQKTIFSEKRLSAVGTLPALFRQVTASYRAFRAMEYVYLFLSNAVLVSVRIVQTERRL
jgi:hypothetical protein